MEEFMKEELKYFVKWEITSMLISAMYLQVSQDFIRNTMFVTMAKKINREIFVKTSDHRGRKWERQ